MPKKLIKNMAKSKDKNEERDERAKRRSLARRSLARDTEDLFAESESKAVENSSRQNGCK